MLKLYTTLLTLIFCVNLFAQKGITILEKKITNTHVPTNYEPELTERTCGTVEHTKLMLQKHPELILKKEASEDIILKKSKEFEFAKNERSSTTYNIPVVVHVVYNNSSENISDAQIFSQIDVLNKDFRKSNSDFNNLIDKAFGTVSSDAHMEFCLAKKDPNNNLTNGITRTSTSHGPFASDDEVKHSNTGGQDAWNPAKYLNIWVCNFSGSLLGYAQPPNGGLSSDDGVAIKYDAFGTVGTLKKSYNLGRTATHEIGHWLDLLHIWGDDNGGCSLDDEISDTPQQKDQNTGCPKYPLITGTGSNCSGNLPGAMFMNFMDYTNDACMFMFTQGQVNRMHAALTTYRASIINSDVCSLPNAGKGYNCDTLSNFSDTLVTTIYAIDTSGWGYISGHNNYLDKAKAERFLSPKATLRVSGCIVKFGFVYANDTLSEFDFNIWDSNDSLGNPKTILATKKIKYSSIVNDVNSYYDTYIQFDNPVDVKQVFYAGIEFNYFTKDTVALYTTEIGKLANGNGNAFEKTVANKWQALNTPDSLGGWGMDISYFIHPIYCDSFVGVHVLLNKVADLIKVFPNPTKDELYITLYDLKNTSISLFTITGNLVEKLDSTNSKGIAHFNTSNFPKGIYFVEVKNENFKIVKKVIIE